MSRNPPDRPEYDDPADNIVTLELYFGPCLVEVELYWEQDYDEGKPWGVRWDFRRVWVWGVNVTKSPDIDWTELRDAVETSGELPW